MGQAAPTRLASLGPLPRIGGGFFVTNSPTAASALPFSLLPSLLRPFSKRRRRLDGRRQNRRERLPVGRAAEGSASWRHALRRPPGLERPESGSLHAPCRACPTACGG